MRVIATERPPALVVHSARRPIAAVDVPGLKQALLHGLIGAPIEGADMSIEKHPAGASPADPAATPATPVTGGPFLEPADQVVAPDTLDEVRRVASCLPNDADDKSDAGSETTDHDAAGWRADPLAKP